MDDETTRDSITDGGNDSDTVGSHSQPDGPGADDHRDSVTGGGTGYITHTLAAVIVAIAGLVYAILQVYGAVADNGDKTKRLEHGVSVIQTAVPKIAEQLAAIPTEQPTFPPVIVETKSGNTPNVIVTQLPGTPGAPGKPGEPGKIITLTPTPAAAPIQTCRASVLGACVVK